MKKSIIISFVLTHFCFLANAQWSLYLLGGISPASHPANADLIINRRSPIDEFFLNMPHAATQYFAGINLRNELKGQFFVELGSVYTKREFSYEMSYIVPREIGTFQELKETEHQISVPVSIGARLNFIEIASGLQANLVLSRKSDLERIEGYEDQSPVVQFGWHSALQFNFGKVLAGIEYQADLQRLCSDRGVNGQSIELMQVPGQCVFKLQFKL